MTIPVYIADSKTKAVIYTKDELEKLGGVPGTEGKQGEKGDAGPGLEFNWNGTQLGVRVQGSGDAYQYINLVGPQGEGIKGDRGDLGPYTFELINGDLILVYADGETAPNYSINASGELILTI